MFARNLNRIMHEKGFTCTMLAKQGGFSKGAVSSWTNGTYVPKPEHVETIARVLGVSVEELDDVEIPKPDQADGPTFVPRKNTLTVKEAAALLHKHESFIQQGLQEGRPGFEFGSAVKASSKWSFCIYAYKFSEVTGIPMEEI